MILSLPTELIERSVLNICRDSRIICLFLSPLVLLRPLVGLRPPSRNWLILSLCLSITTATLSDPVPNTTPEGILSLCWCSLILTHTTSMGIWDGAGATRSWLNIVSLPCCRFVCVICLRLTMNSVGFSSTSVPPSTLLVDCSFKVEEFPKKMAISSAQNSRDKSFFLRKLTISSASVLNIWSHSFLFCLLISSSLSLMLFSTAPFGRPSASRRSSIFHFVCCISVYLAVYPRKKNWRKTAPRRGIQTVEHRRYYDNAKVRPFIRWKITVCYRGSWSCGFKRFAHT